MIPGRVRALSFAISLVVWYLSYSLRATGPSMMLRASSRHGRAVLAMSQARQTHNWAFEKKMRSGACHSAARLIQLEAHDMVTQT
ncbi:hypothetical protein BGZ57DRAFT_897987 [Hyaloscypha finlandica]|nr:hypothetical protein BGZ57DRAFT_897987 [Hyaloscypha finlandica]